MEPFAYAQSWKWSENQKKPAVFVDGESIKLDGRTHMGKQAYVVTVNEKNVKETLQGIDVESLYLYEYRSSSLEALAHLTRLKNLRVEWSTKLVDISHLQHLRGLETLHLVDTKNVSDIEVVANLKDLRDFEFSGGIWNRNVVRTLDPLLQLSQLETVSLKNIKVLEGGMKGLARCLNLKKLDVSNQFDLDDYAYLAGVRPDIQCDLFVAWTPILDGKVMITGKGQPFLDIKKDADRIRKAEERFEALRAQYASK